MLSNHGNGKMCGYGLPSSNIVAGHLYEHWNFVKFSPNTRGCYYIQGQYQADFL